MAERVGELFARAVDGLTLRPSDAICAELAMGALTIRLKAPLAMLSPGSRNVLRSAVRLF